MNLAYSLEEQPKSIDLEVEGLSKSFNGKDYVFKDISFSMGHDEAVALIGANGSGKSTLLRCCLYLIQPTSGIVRLFGKPVNPKHKSDLRELRSQVGFVFQQHNLVPRLSVLTNVVHGELSNSRSPRLWYQGLAPAEVRNKALTCLEQVGLADLADRRAQDLSGGQSQRVAIARALMQSPRMIVADEPVASLDPQAGEEVMELFVKLIHEHGISLIFVSHHLEHALRYSERIIGLKDGKLDLDSTPAAESIGSLRGIYGTE